MVWLQYFGIGLVRDQGADVGVSENLIPDFTIRNIGRFGVSERGSRADSLECAGIWMVDNELVPGVLLFPVLGLVPCALIGRSAISCATQTGLKGKSVVAITLGSGSTAAAQKALEKLILDRGGQLLDSRSLWLLKPNDELRPEESNVKVSVSMAYAWGTNWQRHYIA